MQNNRDIESILFRKNWIFDLDGTLTIAVHDFKAIRDTLGIPYEIDILSHLDALPLEESATLHKTLDSIERELSKKAVAASGAIELLSLLAKDDCMIGILTRNTQEVARMTLEYAGLGEFFREPAFIIGRFDAAPKPDPEGALQLASLWGASPDDIVVAGDYLYDLLCGRNIGAATVHVDPSGEFRWNEFADLSVTSLAELAEMRLQAPGPR
ncbi:MAG: HAD hydrolase-like protein [Desulfuromonadaceae bacterium]|nr:HAD hydrolase-like protein [Desulfuromonadaceae bacterium]